VPPSSLMPHHLRADLDGPLGGHLAGGDGEVITADAQPLGPEVACAASPVEELRREQVQAACGQDHSVDVLHDDGAQLGGCLARPVGYCGGCHISIMAYCALAYKFTDPRILENFETEDSAQCAAPLTLTIHN
jgi:hypothetical protein